MSLFGDATVLLIVAVGWLSQLNASALPSLTNSSSSQSAAAMAAAATAVYCGSFCDTNGAAHPRTRCISGFEICCGTVRRRYCCNVDDADHESFSAAAVLATDDSAACADAVFSDPQLAAAAEAQEDQTANASSRTTTSSPLPLTTLVTSDCGKYCDLDNQQNDRQYCSRVGMICCGTLNARYCCPNGNYDPALSVDNTSCSNSMDFLLQWWYIVVPTVLILILLLAMVLCYAFRYQCWSSQRRSAGRNGGDGDVALQPTSARDFDPTSTYAFQPPAYDSLPKDPPTYSEVVASDADPAAVTNDNAAFVGDDGRAPVTVPGGSPPAPVTAAAPVESGDAQPVSQRPSVAIPNVTPGPQLQQPTCPTVLQEGVYDGVLPPASPPLYTEAVTTDAAASTVAAVGSRNDVDGQRRRHGRRRTRRRSSRERAQGPISAAPPSYNVVVSSTDAAAAVRVHT